MAFCVVGDGAIGLVTALKLKLKFNTEKITLIAPQNRFMCASSAAGAMVNVYGEYEHFDSSWKQTNEEFLELGKKGREGWKSLSNDLGFSDLYTTNDTIVFLQTNHSEFEKNNYTALKEKVMGDGAGRMIQYDSLKEIFGVKSDNKKEAILISGEGAFDSRELLDRLYTIIRNLGVEIIDGKVTHIDYEKSLVSINSQQFDQTFDKIFICAGAQSFALLPDHLSQLGLQGVGTAYVMEPLNDLGPKYKTVVRTANRGGAQCGLHIVPQADGGVYLGAGNYITEPGLQNHRIETIKYLLHRFSDELASKDQIYYARGYPVLGARPKTLDGVPMVGQITDSVYLMTGTNRSGLTWSPALADEAVEWVNSGRVKGFERWSPHRDLLAFGTPDECVSYFINSRCSAAQEHFGDNSRNAEIAENAKKLCDDVVKLGLTSSSDELIHPDHWPYLVNQSKQ